VFDVAMRFLNYQEERFKQRLLIHAQTLDAAVREIGASARLLQLTGSAALKSSMMSCRTRTYEAL
jgi:hypothetical protein